MNDEQSEPDLSALIEEAVARAMAERPAALVYGGGASLNVHLHLSDDSAVTDLLCEVIKSGRLSIVADRPMISGARVRVDQATIHAQHVRSPLHAEPAGTEEQP